MSSSWERLILLDRTIRWNLVVHVSRMIRTLLRVWDCTLALNGKRVDRFGGHLRKKTLVRVNLIFIPRSAQALLKKLPLSRQLARLHRMEALLLRHKQRMNMVFMGKIKVMHCKLVILHVLIILVQYRLNVIGCLILLRMDLMIRHGLRILA